MDIPNCAIFPFPISLGIYKIEYLHCVIASFLSPSHIECDIYLLHYSFTSIGSMPIRQNVELLRSVATNRQKVKSLSYAAFLALAYLKCATHSILWKQEQSLMVFASIGIHGSNSFESSFNMCIAIHAVWRWLLAATSLSSLSHWLHSSYWYFCSSIVHRRLEWQFRSLQARSFRRNKQMSSTGDNWMHGMSRPNAANDIVECHVRWWGTHHCSSLVSFLPRHTSSPTGMDCQFFVVRERSLGYNWV